MLRYMTYDFNISLPEYTGNSFKFWMYTKDSTKDFVILFDDNIAKQLYEQGISETTIDVNRFSNRIEKIFDVPFFQIKSARSLPR